MTGADHARLLLEERERLTEFHGTRCFMRMEAGHCAALVPERGADGVVRWLCSVYERRPQLCRDYERGGPACEVDSPRGPRI